MTEQNEIVKVESAIDTLRLKLSGDTEALSLLDVIQELVLCDISIGLKNSQKLDRILDTLEAPRLKTSAVKSEPVGITKISSRALIKDRR